MKRPISLLAIGIMLTATASFGANPELQPQPLEITDCVTTALGCKICYTIKNGTLTHEVNLGCLGVQPGVSEPNTSRPRETTVASGEAPENTSSDLPPGITIAVAEALGHILSFATHPHPYQIVSDQIDAEIQGYRDQVHSRDAKLNAQHGRRQSDWKQAEPQLKEELQTIGASLDKLSSDMKTGEAELEKALAQLRTDRPGTANPALDFLDRALSAGRNHEDFFSKIPAAHLTPDAVSLGDNWTRALASRLPPQSTPARARVEQEKARLAGVPQSPDRNLAVRALQQAEGFSGLPGTAAHETSEILRKEARALRHQAEGRIPPDPATTAPLSRWLDGFDPNPISSLPSIHVQVQAINALATAAILDLSNSAVTAHLEQQATDALRDQIRQSQGLADSAATLAERSGGRNLMVRTMIDTAYATVRGIHDFTAGLAAGVYDGFYSTGKAIDAIFAQSGTWSRIVNGVMRELSDDPVVFVKKSLEPFVDYAHVMATGTAEEKGRASGRLLAQVLVGMTVGGPVEGVTNVPLRAAFSEAATAVEESAAGRVVGQAVDSVVKKIPSLSRVRSGILLESAEVSTYVERHAALNALPDTLKPKRILVGSVGRDEKVALIGRSMAGGVNDAKEVLASKGMKVETFAPTDAAKMQLRTAIENYGREIRQENPWLPYDRVKLTDMYRENQEWISRKKREGFTIIDIGNPAGNDTTSAFYDIEIETIFGKSK